LALVSPAFGIQVFVRNTCFPFSSRPKHALNLKETILPFFTFSWIEAIKKRPFLAEKTKEVVKKMLKVLTLLLTLCKKDAFKLVQNR